MLGAVGPPPAPVPPASRGGQPAHSHSKAYDFCSRQFRTVEVAAGANVPVRDVSPQAKLLAHKTRSGLTDILKGPLGTEDPGRLSKEIFFNFVDFCDVCPLTGLPVDGTP